MNMGRRRGRGSDPGALEQLRAIGQQAAGMPVPGALPGRVHGRYATATVGGVTLHLFNWEIEYSLELFDATAHGEFWKVRVPGDQEWMGTCEGYFVASDQPYLAAAANRLQDPLSFVFTGYRGMTATPPNRVWQGDCFIQGASYQVPMAMLMQRLRLEGTGIPTITAIPV